MQHHGISLYLYYGAAQLYALQYFYLSLRSPGCWFTSDDRRVGKENHQLGVRAYNFGKQARQPGLTDQNITISKDVQSARWRSLGWLRESSFSLIGLLHLTGTTDGKGAGGGKPWRPHQCSFPCSLSECPLQLYFQAKFRCISCDLGWMKIAQESDSHQQWKCHFLLQLMRSTLEETVDLNKWHQQEREQKARNNVTCHACQTDLRLIVPISVWTGASPHHLFEALLSGQPENTLLKRPPSRGSRGAQRKI